MTRVPFRWQPNDWTCGPAVLSMALASFGVQVEVKRLIRLLGANPKTGTSRHALVRGARYLGFRAHARYRRVLPELVRDLKKGKIVIVLYTEPDGEEPHYAILLGATPKRVRLQDPWNGPHFDVSRKEFVRRWHDNFLAWPHWALSLSQRPKRRTRRTR